MAAKHSILGPDFHPTDAVVIQLGAELSGRQGNRKLVALSKVKFTLKSAEDVRRANDMLVASDQRLAQNSDHTLYDWQLAVLHDMTIYFEVGWYDLGFFEENKDVFLNPNHGRIFAQMGLDSSAVTVHHFKAVA